jgi:hypothetical protein
MSTNKIRKCCPKLRQNLFFFFLKLRQTFIVKILKLCEYTASKLLISDLKSFLSGKTSRGKHPLNLAKITRSQISTPKKQIHIRSSRAPQKIYFANLEYIFHCCKYIMLQRNCRVHSERKINCMQEGRNLLL